MSVAQQTPPVESQTKPLELRRNGRWSAYWNLLSVRLKELKREPEVVFWALGSPLLLALGFGIAFRNKPADITSVAIVSGSGAQDVIRLVGRSSQYSAIRAEVLDRAAALKGFRLGRYDLVVERDEHGGIHYLYDPDRPTSVLSRAEVNNALQSSAGRKDALSTSALPSSEPGSRYIDFLVPGLIGMNLMNGAMWGVGLALVDMRQRKVLKRYVATPMRRSDFLLALASSRLLFMILEVGLLLGFGVLFFGMRVLGSVTAILPLGLIGALAFAGLGLLTASRAQKIESASGLITLVMMPMAIFSGVFFSYERFPAVVHPFIRALPLTALNDALRATLLEGAPLESQSARLLVLVAWGGISFLLALRWFRWT
jgi:ABC-2 type transport system permease protein